MLARRAALVAAGALVAALSAPASALAVERLSVDSAEGQADVFVTAGGETRGSFAPSVSAGGLVVAFSSNAADLVPGDTNGVEDVFVRDRARGTTERVSVGARGTQAHGFSSQGVVSGDGRFVVFASAASNLVAGDANGQVDVFVRDRLARTTQLVSRPPGGGQFAVESSEATISDDGRFVAWRTFGDGDRAYVRDRRTGVTQLAGVAPDGSAPTVSGAAISGDGRFVAFTHHTAALDGDLYVRDRRTGTTQVFAAGNLAQPSISRDGRFVTVVDGVGTAAVVVVVDRRTGARSPVGPGFQPRLSADGRFVAFTEPATGGPQDVLVLDRFTGVTTVASRGADNSSFRPALSADGRTVVFESFAANLVAQDTNAAADVFARDGAPPSLAERLLAALRARVTRFGLAPAVEGALTDRVDAALGALARGDRAAACGSLAALERDAVALARAGWGLRWSEALQVVAGARAAGLVGGCRR